MSGEATILVWDDMHIAFWGTGMTISYASDSDAASGFSGDEIALVSDWWSIRAAIDALFRREPNALPVTRAIAEKVDVHAWRHDARPRRSADVTMAPLKLARDFRTRLAWVPCRGTLDETLTARAQSIVSACAASDIPSSATWFTSAGALMVNRERAAHESAEHAKLIEAYTDECCKAAAKELAKLPEDWFEPMDRDRPMERIDFGDPNLLMSVSFRAREGVADARARIEAALALAVGTMPDALARIESRRPSRPRAITHEEPTLKLHVETSFLMSPERAREWTAEASSHARSLAAVCVSKLQGARKKTNVPPNPSAPMDCLLTESTDWFRTTMFYPGSSSQKERERLYEALRR